MNSFRGGMQVHAVPEDERALDAQGKPLPWGYAYADPNLNRKQAIEKGPFGRSTNRRSMTRKAATPVRKEDVLLLENQKVVDDVFTKFKKELDEKQTSSDRRTAVSQTPIPLTRSSTDAQQVTSTTTAPAGPSATTFKEPSEVMIYGFGADYQYAAIEFYETVSNGRIYEDYDRYPPHPRYNTFSNTTRASIPRTLSQDAIRRINTYQGGEHWIKVTFDSPEASELACYYSPHILHGYLVHAEQFRGVPPSADVAIAASSNPQIALAGTISGRRAAGASQQTDWSTLPARLRSAPAVITPHQQQPQLTRYTDNSPPSSSETTTASSATATATGNDTLQQDNQPSLRMGTNTSSTDTAPRSPSPPRPLRIARATRAVLHPASAALLPVPHWTRRTFGHLPIVGSIFGGPVATGGVASAARPAGGLGSGGFIGNSVPRKDDGSFDYDRASWWWRICWTIDYFVGSDICGVKGGD